MRHPPDLPASEFLQSIHEDDYAAAAAKWQETLTSRKGVTPIEFRVRPTAEDTAERWCYAVASPELDAAGNIVSVTGALTDVSDSHLMLRYQEQRAEEAISMKEAQERCEVCLPKSANET